MGCGGMQKGAAAYGVQGLCNGMRKASAMHVTPKGRRDAESYLS